MILKVWSFIKRNIPIFILVFISLVFFLFGPSLDKDIQIAIITLIATLIGLVISNYNGNYDKQYKQNEQIKTDILIPLMENIISFKNEFTAINHLQIINAQLDIKAISGYKYIYVPSKLINNIKIIKNKTSDLQHIIETIYFENYEYLFDYMDVDGFNKMTDMRKNIVYKLILMRIFNKEFDDIFNQEYEFHTNKPRGASAVNDIRQEAIKLIDKQILDKLFTSCDYQKSKTMELYNSTTIETNKALDILAIIIKSS